MDDGSLLRTLTETLDRASYERYEGSDPYDCLNSPITSRLPGRMAKIAATQIFVYSPINLRPLFLINKGRNPKGLALFLLTLLESRRKNSLPNMPLDKRIEDLLAAILGCVNNDHSGPCWGYNFPWQDLHKFIPRGQPSVVVTSFVAKTFYEMVSEEVRPDPKEQLAGIGRFITEDLNRFEDGDGTCLSYSPHDENIVHNANLLGAVTLARIMKATDDGSYSKLVRSCLEFTLSKQHKDGSWAYSQNSSGKERNQIDFHQGFVLESLMDLAELGVRSDLLYPALRKGLQFYERQFRPDGASYWRYPKRWPIDIHHQAQGIITFERASRYHQGYRSLSDRILDWTLEHFYNGDGRFSYQIWPALKNRITYVRWGNAWMAYAMSMKIADRSSIYMSKDQGGQNPSVKIDEAPGKEPI